MSERKPVPASKQKARLAASPFDAPVGFSRKASSAERKRSSSSEKLLSGGGIQRGLALSRSTSSLVQPPSWDPVKQRLDATPFQHAPLWRDDALDAGNGSKSLMRALASSGQLVRPSIKAFEAFEKERSDFYTKKREESRKNADKAEAAKAAKEERRQKSLRVENILEDINFKNGEAEGFIGKIHDEELVEQQVHAHSVPHRHPPHGEAHTLSRFSRALIHTRARVRTCSSTRR